jgi:hypothetical protein
MLYFEPVRLDFKKALIARQLFRGVAIRRQRQTRVRIILDFFQQPLHGRISCEQNILKASAVAMQETFSRPRRPVTLCVSCQSNSIPMPP